MKRRDLSKHANSIPSDSPLLLDRVSFSVLAVLQVVCPLLFFTNLTRNPYYTQIVLLNILVLLLGLMWVFKIVSEGVMGFFVHPLQAPLFMFLAVAFWSTIHSWIVHLTVRSGIAFESARVWAFTIANAFMVFLPSTLLFKNHPIRVKKRNPSPAT